MREAIDALQDLVPSDGELIELLSALSGVGEEQIAGELKTHLATRVCFLLMGELVDAPNFDVAQLRLAGRVGTDRTRIAHLTKALARCTRTMAASTVTRRLSLTDLPYPVRKDLQSRQNHRCAVCGLGFRNPVPAGRTPEECNPSLDHVVPHRLGGDSLDNLQILCSLCNGAKSATLHIGEHGRVWIDNFVYGDSPRLVAFWTLARRKTCAYRGCGIGALESRLFVARIGDRGPWVVDNCEVRCSEHHVGTTLLSY